MSHEPSNRRVVRFPESLEFEPTDFGSAREAHDQPPPGVERIPEFVPDFWVLKRRRPTAVDRAMTGDALAWVMALPPMLRPHTLCDRFPRVANTLAASWHDPQARIEALSDLLVDHRGGRRGFPYEVRGEIEALWREVSPAVPVQRR